VSARVDLCGIIPPILTPTDAHDCVDEPALRRAIQRLLAAGVHGLFVAGTAGEGPLLAERQWERLMEIAQDEVANKVPLLAGAQDVSTRKVIDKIRRLVALGYRHCVVTPTFYIPTRTAAEHLRHFEACRAAAADMELIAYNIPQVVGTGLAVETICELARRGWVRHCKESSGDLPFLRRLITEGRELGLRVLMGDERNSAAGLRAGAVGLVNLCSNLQPEVYLRLYAAAQCRDEAAMNDCQAHINRLVDEVVLSGPCFVAGPKYLLSRLGIGRGVPVAPLQPADEGQARKIDAFLTTLT
jgi:4-hydroxy-tetrahydrodipicolinate synthase